ncbi:hypothetical protein [Gramella sp. AN32]|uniref:Photosystem I assembly protein Ycf4 n=1 Tax=Christiangramia antarctica TaxID=2058158 RepID=A0ABW5X232_9FLAO|nr:hypothetical protein [Gramella sp. AN32]MCM4157180.1 hypothetical protein [Gramella sp. AN32]
MESFETRIVKTWKPSKWLRTLGIVLLVASAASVFVWKPDIPWLSVLSYFVYAITFLFALSLSFIKSKNLGGIFISEENIEIDFQGEKQIFLISDLKQLGFNNRGYGSFWKHKIQENKDHLYFMDGSGDKYDYEISIQNKEKKEGLKQFLKVVKPNSPFKVEGQTGRYSF